MNHAGAVLVAAGRGRRLGGGAAGRPKALVEVEGRPLLALAVDHLRAVHSIVCLVVVHPPGAEAAFRDVVGPDVALTVGGPTRAASVRAGVGALPEEAELVAIHDAARALVPPSVIQRALAAVTGDVVAAAPGLPVPDTLKRVDRDGVVEATVPRRGLWAAHTPQIVRRDVLAAVLRTAEGSAATDDLGLVEDAIAAGVVTGRVVLVRGDPHDLKVTYPEDLHVAAALVRMSYPRGDDAGSGT